MFKTFKSFLYLKYLLLNSGKSHHMKQKHYPAFRNTWFAHGTQLYRVQWMTLSRNSTAILEYSNPAPINILLRWGPSPHYVSRRAGPYDHSMIDLFDSSTIMVRETRKLTQDYSSFCAQHEWYIIFSMENFSLWMLVEVFFEIISEIERTFTNMWRKLIFSHWLVCLRLFYVSCKRGC